MQALTNIGAEQALTIRKGVTFGPVRFWAKNPDKSPADLTGAEIKAEITPANGDPVPFEISVTLPNIIDLTFPASASEGLPGLAAFWQLWIIWPTGRVDECVHGPVRLSVGRQP